MSDLIVHHVPLNQIQPGNNDRKHFDPTKLAELAANIKQHGLAQPITIRSADASSAAKYEIVAGERRYRAHQINSAETIPAIIRTLTDEQASAIMLVENTSRADLNPIEEANGYQSRIDKYDWSIQKLAQTAGVSETRVRNRLKLLHLHPDAQHLVAHNNIPIGHAELLSTLDHNRQLIALRVLTNGKSLTKSQFSRMVGELEQEQNQDTLIDLSTLWIQLSEQQEKVALRGKAAVVNVPTSADLPTVTPQNTTSETIANYIKQLTQSGNDTAAAAIGTLYTALIHQNFMSLPTVG